MIAALVLTLSLSVSKGLSIQSVTGIALPLVNTAQCITDYSVLLIGVSLKITLSKVGRALNLIVWTIFL